MQHFIKTAYYIEKTLEKCQNDAFLTKKTKKSKKSRKKVLTTQNENDILVMHSRKGMQKREKVL